MTVRPLGRRQLRCTVGFRARQPAFVQERMRSGALQSCWRADATAEAAAGERWTEPAATGCRSERRWLSWRSGGRADALSEHATSVTTPTVREHLVVRRVLIFGRGGAGKSTLARRLGEMLQLPVVELDKVYWQTDGSPTPAAAWRPTQERLVAENAWILDGDLGPGDVVEPRLRAADIGAPFQRRRPRRASEREARTRALRRASSALRRPCRCPR